MATIIPFIPLGGVLLNGPWVWPCASVLVSGTLSDVTQRSEGQLYVALLLLLLGTLNQHNVEELGQACWRHVAQ